MFKLVSKFSPAGDQPKAITALTKGLNDGKKFQVLLGATGTGKTFTIAHVIANTQKKTLVMAHNKTLAAQLYSELKELFPENRVEYFVSYFDFYQPEAYVPRTDTFIEKSAMVNQDIEMLRLSTLNSLTTRDDVIVVASVACIYAAANPAEFEKYRMIFSHGQKVSIKEIQDKLVKLNYKRNPIDLSPGNFRLKGDVLEVAPGWTGEYTIRFSFDNDVIESIATIDALTGEVTDQPKVISIYPADEYVMDSERITESLRRITEEMKQAVVDFKAEGKLLEAQRIEERTTRDVESLREFGMCPGIENYTRHLELRNEGDTPFTLFDYFGKDWLLVMDESHMSVPQIRGMYNTDRSRKETLVRFGFRLRSALDNRPLNFDEYQKKIAQVLFVSATPNEWELEKAEGVAVEQIVRPTGLLDPVVEVRPSSGQIDDLLFELKKTIATGGKVFVTTLTIRMAEELSEYTKSRGIKSAYLHNELKTLERSKILNDLRRGKFDVVIGINLLREGLDIPEVSLVAILDADKEGFLRNTKSLIQTIGRAARNVNGRVVMYADRMTESIKAAISETDRRRSIQDAYNKKHGITPQTIVKDIRVDIRGKDGQSEVEAYISKRGKKSSRQKAQIVARLRREMLEAAKNQEYERAAAIRDQMLELEAAD